MTISESRGLAASVHTISVIVPVYNGGRTIRTLCERLGRVLPGLASEYELILVDDGSPDESWSVIHQLCDEYGWVRGIQLMRNFGQHNALLCGIRFAKYDVLMTMDDDLQHPPELMSVLMEKLAEGFDVVYGTPRERQHGLLRNMASGLTKIVLQGAMGAETARRVSAWRAIRKDVCSVFDHYENSFVSIDVLLTWGTTRFSWVEVQHEPRVVGKSNYTVAKLLRHAINMVTGFSVLPLQFASLVGFFFTIFGIGVLLYVVIRYFASGGSIPGFPFLASIIAIFSGAQLFALGIIGEYIARIHAKSTDRPAYAVRRVDRDDALEH